MAAAAPSSLASSVEKTNLAKLSRLLIDGGTTALRTVFDKYYPSANLAAGLDANYPTLYTLKTRRVLHKLQWDLLFPPVGATPDSKTFDITLLFLLLTNICGLSPPLSGWHKPPPSCDTSLEANLTRVKLYRNELYGHVTSTGVQTAVFNVKWREISAVLVALGLNQVEVVRLKSAPCGEDYISAVIEWVQSDEDIVSQLEELLKKQQDLLKMQEEHNRILQNTRVAVEGAWQIPKYTHEVTKEVLKTQQKGHEIQHEDHSTPQETQQTVKDVWQINQDTKQVVKEVLKTQQEVHQIQHEDHSTPQETQQTVKDVRRINQDTNQARVPSTQDAPAKENQGKSSTALTVTLLASEWDSPKGGFSTITRQLATELAKHEQVKVIVLVPQYSCSEEGKRIAEGHKVSIREAERRPGYDDPLDWLSFPPRDLAIDIIVGHGRKLGKQAQVIRESHGCKWVKVLDTDPEELGMYKDYSEAISKGEERNTTEVDLCRLADGVVAVGPKVTEEYSSKLRSCGKDKDIIQLTPGIFDEFSDVIQVAKDDNKFKVLTFGCGDPEDFSLRGYDIAAKAIAKLEDRSYRLIFVGASDGKQEEVAKNLLKSGISGRQLRVRKYLQSKERLKGLFCEVDLVIMPSRTEGFGLTALEALSAGLPILVNGKSGFGDTLCTLPLGKPFVVDSADPKDWAKAIAAVRLKDRTERLQEIQRLRTSYEEKFSWGKQCEALVKKMWSLVHVRDFPFHQWTQGECVGAGNFGKVYKCHVGYDFDNIVAVKIVKMVPQYTETQEEVKALNNEIRILKTLRHERIVSYYGSQQKDGHLHLFMDFMAGGSLSAHIKNRGVLLESESQRYTKQLLKGVKFLHSQNVIHRDIKGSNVLLDGKGNVKLADFGLSKLIQKVGSKTNLVSHCGTPYWMAPEIFWGGGYGRKADIWSLGCTVVEMLTGKPPLRDLEPAAAMFRIGSRPIEPTLPDNVSQYAKEFITAALTWKPDERPWSDELLCYAFVDWMADG